MVSTILIALIALLHVYILVLEMFLWTKPLGRKAFNLTVDFAQMTKTLAANQGLYNGFLAAGLFWGLSLTSLKLPVLIFFLTCILIAGIFGAFTASKKILWIQAVPAALALGALFLGI